MKVLAMALAAVLLVPSIASAWGGDDHQIVCLIAEERLTPQAQAAIHDLLGADVNVSDAEICMWADQIRLERLATAPWHYVNVPTSRPSYDAQRDGKDRQRFSQAVHRQQMLPSLLACCFLRRFGA